MAYEFVGVQAGEDNPTTRTVTGLRDPGTYEFFGAIDDDPTVIGEAKNIAEIHEWLRDQVV
jgi:hypothetical protein